MADITETGVTGKTLVQYRDEITGEYFNVDPTWNVLPESPDGQVIAIWSEALANLDEQVQYAYMSRDPSTAIGQALEDIAEYAGIQRNLGTYSTSEVTLKGTIGTIIPAGKRVRNKRTGTLWEITTERQIAGEVTTPVRALERGAVTAAVGELTEIVDPVAGWQSVTNNVAAIVGKSDETDTELRARRDSAVALPGANQVDNITSGVLDVENVQSVRVYENPESTPDDNGLNPHSIAIFVQGGDADTLRTAIAVRKNPGTNMNKNNGIANEVSKDTTTPLGNPLNITFFRPFLIQAYVYVVVDSTEMAASEKQVIADAIVDFAVNGFSGSGFTKTGFGIGDSVPAGKLYTPVNNIVGGRGFTSSINVGETPNPQEYIINVNFNQMAVFNADAVTVVYANELE